MTFETAIIALAIIAAAGAWTSVILIARGLASDPVRIIATVLVADPDGRAFYDSLDENAPSHERAEEIFEEWFAAFDDPYLISMITIRSQP